MKRAGDTILPTASSFSGEHRTRYEEPGTCGFLTLIATGADDGSPFFDICLSFGGGSGELGSTEFTSVEGAHNQRGQPLRLLSAWGGTCPGPTLHGLRPAQRAVFKTWPSISWRALTGSFSRSAEIIFRCSAIEASIRAGSVIGIGWRCVSVSCSRTT